MNSTYNNHLIQQLLKKKLFLVFANLFSLLLQGSSQGSVVVTQITEPLFLAEGPFWDVVSQKLYYVDIEWKTLRRLDPFSKEEQVLQLDRTPSFIIPVRGSEIQFVVALDRDLVLLTWDFRSGLYTTCLLASVDVCCPGNRLNEAKADRLGRVWAGSKGPEHENNESPPDRAALYRVDATLPRGVAVDVALAPVTISNGLVWSLDYRFLYYIDSPTRRVDVFCFDLWFGLITRRGTVFRLDDHGLPGIPDGLNIDSKGFLYVTINGGGQVVKFDPSTGAILLTIAIPVSRVTSVEFGGPLLDILFVTTMKSKVQGEVSEPQAGAVFAVTGLGVRGTRSNRALVNTCWNVVCLHQSGGLLGPRD